MKIKKTGWKGKDEETNPRTKLDKKAKQDQMNEMNTYI